MRGRKSGGNGRSTPRPRAHWRRSFSRHVSRAVTGSFGLQQKLSNDLYVDNLDKALQLGNVRIGGRDRSLLRTDHPGGCAGRSISCVTALPFASHGAHQPVVSRLCIFCSCFDLRHCKIPTFVGSLQPGAYQTYSGSVAGLGDWEPAPPYFSVWHSKQHSAFE